MKNLLGLLFLLFFSFYTNAQNEEFGLASFYSDKFDGGKTAYGDVYDKDKLTTAHKKHPYGTYLRITRLDNKKSVVVKVIDKGPYIKGRVVDLSRRAATQLGLSEDGVAEVKVEVVDKDGNSPVAGAEPKKPIATIPDERPAAYGDEVTSTSTVAPAPDSKPKAREVPVVKEEPAKAAPVKTETAKTVAAKTSETTKTASSRSTLVRQDYTQYGLYKISLERPTSKGFGVQVASLSNYDNVLKQVADLQAKWFENILISVEKGTDQSIYKIILGPFPDEKTAQGYEKSLLKKHKVKGFTVNLDEIQY